jgi:hypothetical protein
MRSIQNVCFRIDRDYADIQNVELLCDSLLSYLRENVKIECHLYAFLPHLSERPTFEGPLQACVQAVASDSFIIQSFCSYFLQKSIPWIFREPFNAIAPSAHFTKIEYFRFKSSESFLWIQKAVPLQKVQRSNGSHWHESILALGGNHALLVSSATLFRPRRNSIIPASKPLA